MKPHDPTAVDDARWHAQERARRGEPEADPLDLRVARALRQAPPMALPPDFAARVATRARADAAANRIKNLKCAGDKPVFKPLTRYSSSRFIEL